MLVKLMAVFMVLTAPGALAQSEPVVITVPAPTPVPEGDICDAYGQAQYPGCVQSPEQSSCLAYNRDGVTCEQVGLEEGQVAAPWGEAAGLFRCVDGCLDWVEQTPHCQAYNHDGVTCEQVGFHEGQVGYPWGHHSGKFRCVDSCLQFVWWW